MRSTVIAMTALALALGGCNRPNVDADHPKVDYTTSLMSRMSAADIDRVTTPPAPPQRGPIPPNANAADPATNASLAFPPGWANESLVPAAGSDHSPDGTHVAVMAQEAAAKAPDTASADEAKRKVYEDAARAPATSDTAAKAREADRKPASEAMNTEATNRSSSEPMAARPSSASGGEPMSAQRSSASDGEPMAGQTNAPSNTAPADASGKS